MARASFGALVAVIALAGCQTLAAPSPSVPVAYGPSTDGTTGLIGNKLGPDIDANSRRLGLDAEYRALEFGEAGVAVDWGGRGGVSGVVVPGTRYRINDTDCREFTHTLMEKGATQSATATACRGTDASWRVVY